MNRVVSDKEALCFKNVKPHWTVLDQVTKKRQTLRHLLELRPKRKESRERWSWMLRVRAALPGGVALARPDQNFAMKLTGLAVVLGIISDF